MDNQQERSLGWLAGIIDGEGSISVQVYTLPDGRVRITPFVCLVNTDDGILNEAFRIMNELTEDSKDARPRWCNNQSKAYVGSFPGKKPVVTIRIDGRATRFILEPLLPHLRSTKRRGAEVILQYLDIRDKRMLQRNEKGQIERQGYTRSEVELISSIRTSSRAKSSEAICRAPNVTDDGGMIWSDLTGDRERPAELETTGPIAA